MGKESDSLSSDTLPKAAKRPDAFIGTTIDGKYLIEEKLGGGGMGAVYRAQHSLMNRTVAIKVLHAHTSVDKGEEFFKRFQREAQTTSKLSHPNCITIYDFGIDHDCPYLVMEYNRGQSLKAVIKQEAPLSLSRVQSIFQQICCGIEEAHSIGVIHRDLKPDNIMLNAKQNGEEQVVVLDFGIAKLLSSSEMTSMTQTGGIIGTPQYMAPEQVMGKELDERCDIYSLGVILYEMLSGQVPFEADSAMALLMKHLHDQPLLIRDLKPELNIPEAVEVIVSSALQKEPSARYQTVRELSDALDAAMQGRAVSPREIANRNIGVHRLAVGAGLSAAIAIVLALVYNFFSPFSTSDPQQIAANIKAAEVVVASSGSSKPIAPQLPRQPTATELNLLGQAETMYYNDKPQDAQPLLDQLLKSHPNYVAVRSLLGLCLLKLNKPTEAFEQLGLALDLKPNDHLTRYGLALYYAKQNQHGKAVRELKLALKLFPLYRSRVQRQAEFAAPQYAEVLTQEVRT